MADDADTRAGSATRCGIDTVEIARIQRLLEESPPETLQRIFTALELAESGEGPGRAASLAARFAAKEACAKLFPRELALGGVEPLHFSVARDGYGAPRVVYAAQARALLDRHRITEIAISLSHDRTHATAVALAVSERVEPPLAGRFLYHALPVRKRTILENLRRVFGPAVAEHEIVRLAQAHYAHLWRLLGELARSQWAPARMEELVRVENVDAFARALALKKGVLVLAGHFGNFEVSTVAGLAQYPEMRGRIHVVRRVIKPRWLDNLLTRRFRQAGLGVLGKRGSLDAILGRLAAGDVVVFPFDQHAGPPDGIEVEFFGHPAWTFKSLAIIALATGAPVIPAAGWREPAGSHVLRFEEAVPPIEGGSVGEEIRHTTRAYNAVLERLVLRHPEQWYWVHKRWKRVARQS